MYALTKTRSSDFSGWYQEVIKEGDLAVVSPVRGCMIIRPNGNGMWERIRSLLNRIIEETGHENLYFPIFIPMSLFEKESAITDGFAKEMAVVTHYRLKNDGGTLIPDPDSVLTDPLIVRPTSELIVGQHMKDSIQSYRDLPVLWNQWANVVRWEMRTRLFLRTAEFLWQEGHTAHSDKDGALAETMRMLEVYRSFSEEILAMPVIVGEKPEHERFPGAVSTFSIEAMMQDGKALQAGTSHYLGTRFSKAQDIKFQSKDSESIYCHTTSWGVSTRLIGGVIMTHGDDDGMRMPPPIAPRQFVIVPMLRGGDSDGKILDYCESLAQLLRETTYMGEGQRVLVDNRDGRSVEKIWSWVKRGAPVICEIGEKDVSKNNVTFVRRDLLRNSSGKLERRFLEKMEFVAGSASLLNEIQTALFAQAKSMMEQNLTDNVRSIDELKAYFASSNVKGEDEAFRGWVVVPWSRPTGDALNEIVEILKGLKLTIRGAPLDQSPVAGPCLFTGQPTVENIIIARSY